MPATAILQHKLSSFRSLGPTLSGRATFWQSFRVSASEMEVGNTFSHTHIFRMRRFETSRSEEIVESSIDISTLDSFLLI